jgi:hypothetical protein
MFAMVFKCFQVFLQVFQKNVSSASSILFFILQMLHLNALKVDQASAVNLHLIGGDQISSGVSRLHGG